MKKFSDYSAHIEKTLRDLTFPGNELAGLYEPVSYSLSAGGKRLRPSLALMAADAFGNAAERAERAAVGLEIFHNFTLLHDDVMDQSDMRRGRPSVHAKWDVNTAILSGDTMLTLATRCVSDVDDSILRRVLDTFNEMALRVYEGQRLDMMLGLAFQIQDDWLDVFGDSMTFGKPIGGDINNNKKSFLLLTALATDTPDATALKEAMKLPAGDTKIKIVTRLYERLDMTRHCREAIAAYSAKALGALKATSLSDDAREPFRLLVDKLTGRKK